MKRSFIRKTNFVEVFFFQWPSIWGHLAHEESCIPVQFINFVLVQAIMCCSFSVIQGARVEISMDASDFTTLLLQCFNDNWNTVKPLFIVFVGGLKKKQWIRENNRCRSHSLNRIRSGTIEIERRIRENKLSGNDRGFTLH
jgi:hypothetical protein